MSAAAAPFYFPTSSAQGSVSPTLVILALFLRSRPWGVRSYLIMVLFCIMTGDVGGLFMCLLLDLCINPLWRNIHSGPCLLFKLNSVLVVAELWELFVHPRC